MSKGMTRKTFLGTAGLVAATTLAACGGKGGKGGAGSSADEGGATVYWLNFKPEIDELLQKLAKQYSKDKGINVKVKTAAAGTYEQTLTADMDKAEKAPTLFVIGNSAGVKSWGGYAIDLKGTDIQKEEIDDTYDLFDADGKMVSQGYCYECYGIIANKDLVEKAGHSMDEITNFEGLKKVVEDIHKRKDELGFDAFTACDMTDDSSWRFTGHMANLEYFYEEKKAGKKWDECPKTITGEFLPNYKMLFDLCINNCTVDPKTLSTDTSYSNGQEFIDGKAAFDVQGSWQYATYAEAQKNTTMIPYYCGVEGEEKAGLNCGTENRWAVNTNSSEEQQKATQDFMVWLVTDADASAQLVEQLGIMPFQNAAKSTNGYLNAAAAYTEKGNYVMDWVTSYQPNVDDYRKALVSAMNAYCADQTDANWDAVKTAFVDGWATQYAKANA
ncbi:ABC transporter substrate-binding protein [Atopobium sp. oral taxon 810]|uniref:ABC transporter substrate-binding protein n=1 Tax=Atopobium sp. oral taxon 810 TaxID=712158 RepID=UPI0003978087|nr:ABC transporter substrate-binding protein [Atopobium sp. oral taxon 810]ERI04179.1 ABC transporter, solute-binding protein [Atopobium sp. oral taxon 810 str. F0209]